MDVQKGKRPRFADQPSVPDLGFESTMVQHPRGLLRTNFYYYLSKNEVKYLSLYEVNHPGLVYSLNQNPSPEINRGTVSSARHLQTLIKHATFCGMTICRDG